MASGAVPALAPSNLSTLALWLEGSPSTLFSDTSRTTAQTTDSGAVKAIIQPGDSAGNYRFATQATNNPTLSIVNGRYWLNPSALAGMTIQDSSVACTGDFTIWVVMNGTGAMAEALPIGGSTGAVGAGLDLHADGGFYFCVDDAYVQTALVLPSGNCLVRARRASGTAYVAVTGTAEINMGALAGTATFSDLMARASGHFCTRPIGAIILGTANYSAAIQAGIESYLHGNWGVSL